MALPARRRLADRVRRRALSFLAGPELDAYVRGVARASRVEDHVVFGDPSRAVIGDQVELNDALLNVVSGRITIERTAFFGHGVQLLTGTHDVDRLGRERQTAVPPEGRDIVVERGAWVASGATVIGPSRIGAHAVVCAGAVVVGDVPAGVVVAGVPARATGRTIPVPASA